MVGLQDSKVTKYMSVCARGEERSEVHECVNTTSNLVASPRKTMQGRESQAILILNPLSSVGQTFLSDN